MRSEAIGLVKKRLEIELPLSPWSFYDWTSQTNKEIDCPLDAGIFEECIRRVVLGHQYTLQISLHTKIDIVPRSTSSIAIRLYIDKNCVYQETLSAAAVSLTKEAENK